MGKSLRVTIGAVTVFGLVFAACSDDDGASVRNLNCAESSASASGSGSVSGSVSCPSGSGSASGLSRDDLSNKGADNPFLATAVTEYKRYVGQQVDDTIARTKTFTDAVRAGNVQAAKAAYAPSRQGWETIEPIADLVEEIDGAVDARVDDFEGVDDPEFTGWHRIEYLLWEQNNATSAVPFADQLDADLQTLKDQLTTVEITPLVMARGSAELVEEVSEDTITGEEDRYSHTDLWDFAANIAGAKRVVELLTPALQQEAPALLGNINEKLAAVEAGLAPYRTPDGGYQSSEALTAEDTTRLKADLASLSEELAEVPGALGLE